MVGRTFSSSNSYRYGFNGKENDKDISDGGQDYGMRIYDNRLGKFLSNDLLSKNYPYYSPYHFAGCNPIRNIDMDGGEPKDYTWNWIYQNTFSTITGKSNGTASFTSLARPGRSESVITTCEVNAIFDKTSHEFWFVHEGFGGQYFYWKHDPGADQMHLIVSNKAEHSNGHWEPFSTQNQIQTSSCNALVDATGMAVFGIFAAGAAAPAALSGLTSLTESVAELPETAREFPELYAWIGYTGAAGTVGYGYNKYQASEEVDRVGLGVNEEGFNSSSNLIPEREGISCNLGFNFSEVPKASELREWATKQGYELLSNSNGIETWGLKEKEGWRLKLKQPSITPGIDPGSQKWRFSARTKVGEYYNPVTGQSGKKKEFGHMDLDPN